MEYTIQTKKYGTITVNPENESFEVEHPLFKFVEDMFDKWYDECTNDPYYSFAKDIKEAYTDDEYATCTKKGAIQGGIEGIFEQMYENDVTFVTQRTIEDEYDILTTFMP